MKQEGDVKKEINKDTHKHAEPQPAAAGSTTNSTIPATSSVSSTGASTTHTTHSEPVAPNSPITESKSGGGCFKWLALGCIAFVVISCCLLCGLFFLAPAALSSLAASTTKGRDESLARVESNQLVTLKQGVDSKNETRDTQVKSPTGKSTISYSEQEVAYLMVEALKLETNPDEVGVELRPNYMKVEFGLKALLEQAEAEGQLAEGTKLEWAKDLYFSIELSTVESGSKLQVDKISTGNSLIDAFIPSDLTVDLEDDINKSFAGDNVKLERIDFEQDQLTLTYAAK